MKLYLAARYSRREELCGYREQLEELGHEVTSRWLNGKHQISDEGTPIGDHGEALVEGDDGSASVRSAELRLRFAQEDVADVLAANALVSFTEPPRSSASRGGRHVEHGIWIGLNACSQLGHPQFRRPVYVVGHRENIFHWLPDVQFFETWGELYEHLKGVA